jgi:[protein-PII] uridylyltransferase
MSHGDRLRSIVREVRQQLVEGRQQLRAQHELGMEGTRVCARYTTLVDQAIQRIYDAYLNELPEASSKELRERVALVAHGGFGRRQQAPFSDVDLMVLFDGKRDALIGQLASRLIQDICDVYQHLGQSLRTPADAVQLARTDAQVGTSLLESRLLLGNSALFDRYSAQMKAMIEKRGPGMAADFIAERRTERLEYGETVYLLEPNVKRSRGGLRDIHLLRWLWYLKAGVADPDRLHDMGVLSKFDHRQLLLNHNLVDLPSEAGKPSLGSRRAMLQQQRCQRLDEVAQHRDILGSALQPSPRTLGKLLTVATVRNLPSTIVCTKPPCLLTWYRTVQGRN